MRSEVRECVFKYIFARLFNPSDEGLFAVLCKDLDNDDKTFATELLTAINKNEDIYTNKIEQLSISFKLNRVYRADKCTLLIGMAELDNFPNTPVAVVIDEAVNLAGKYSTENSTNFVNGILAQFAKEVRNG